MDLPKVFLPLCLIITLGVGQVIGLDQIKPTGGNLSVVEDSLWLIDSVYLKAIPVLPIKGQVLATIIEPENIIPDSLLNKVIQCESGWDNSARGKAGEIGLAQFMPDTWRLFNKIRNTNLDIYNENDQLEMIIWAFQNGYENHWTCYRKLVS